MIGLLLAVYCGTAPSHAHGARPQLRLHDAHGSELGLHLCECLRLTTACAHLPPPTKSRSTSHLSGFVNQLWSGFAATNCTRSHCTLRYWFSGRRCTWLLSWPPAPPRGSVRDLQLHVCLFAHLHCEIVRSNAAPTAEGLYRVCARIQ
jgi:hypothetical protein